MITDIRQKEYLSCGNHFVFVDNGVEKSKRRRILVHAPSKQLGVVLLGVGLLLLAASLFFIYYSSQAAHPFVSEEEWVKYYKSDQTMAIFGAVVSAALAIVGWRLMSKKSDKGIPGSQTS